MVGNHRDLHVELTPGTHSFPQEAHYGMPQDKGLFFLKVLHDIPSGGDTALLLWALPLPYLSQLFQLVCSPAGDMDGFDGIGGLA